MKTFAKEKYAGDTSWFDYSVAVKQREPLHEESVKKAYYIIKNINQELFCFTCGLQCSSSQLKTQAESSAKFATDTFSNVWNNRSIIAWN